MYLKKESKKHVPKIDGMHAILVLYPAHRVKYN